MLPLVSLAPWDCRSAAVRDARLELAVVPAVVEQPLGNRDTERRIAVGMEVERQPPAVPNASAHASHITCVTFEPNTGQGATLQPARRIAARWATADTASGEPSRTETTEVAPPFQSITTLVLGLFYRHKRPRKTQNGAASRKGSARVLQYPVQVAHKAAEVVTFLEVADRPFVPRQIRHLDGLQGLRARRPLRRARQRE